MSDFTVKGARRPSLALPRPFGRFVGFAFIQAWLACACLVGFLPAAKFSASVVSNLALQACAGVMASSAIVLFATIRVVPLSRRRPLCVASALGCAVFSLAMCAFLGDIALWFLAGPSAFLAGMCAGVQVLAWQEYFSTLGVRRAVSGLAASSAIGAAFFLACMSLPFPMNVAFFAALPLMGEVTRRPAPGTRFYSSSSGSIDMRTLLSNMVHDYSPRMYVLCMLACMAFGCACYAAPVEWGFASGPAGMVLLCLTGLAMCAACLAVLLNPPALLMRLFYVALPLLMVSAVLVGLGSEAAGPWALLVGAVGTSLSYNLVWSLMVSVAADKRLPTLGLAAFLHVSCFAGAFVGLLAAEALRGDVVRCSILMLVALGAAALLFASFNGKVKVTEEAYVSLGQAGFDQAIVQLAKRCGLTPREVEVLQAWATGHNANYVEQTLNISRNTVKSHLNHIYQKTGTAGREDLIVLLESLMPGNSSNK